MKNGPYTLIVPPKEYPGKKYRDKYAYEHHVVWWIHNHEIIKPGFEIHHINGNHQDNKIKNLKLITSKEHKLIHSKIRRQNATINMQCFWCKNEFEGIKSKLLFRFKKNKNKIYCGRSCQVKAQWNERNFSEVP